MHVKVTVDASNGLRATADCPGSTSRVFESYPQQFQSWATSAGRPIAPSDWSPRCTAPRSPGAGTAPQVAYPPDGSKFFLDPALSPAQQQLVFVARSASAAGLRFVVNGQVLPASSARTLEWPLRRGRYRVHVEDLAGRASSAVSYDVF
jgi:penicillin-binding protein 1C